MEKKRTDRLNSLLKEVISEVIMRDVHDPRMAKFVSITRVDITKDLHHAKVFVSIIGNEEEKLKTLTALHSAANFIAVTASKKVVMRYFPELNFKLDDSVDKHFKIDTLLKKIHDERQTRHPTL